MSNKLDVYGDIALPFDVAALCRSHKFSPVAVSIARKLREKQEAIARRDALEAQIDKIESEISLLADTARERFGG